MRSTRQPKAPAALPPVVNLTHEPRDYRRELWIGVAIATAGSSNCTKTTSAEMFADAALEAFDKRFPSSV